jgi:hypothetical protein
MWSLVPIEFQPLQTFVNGRGRFLGVARLVRVFDSQNEFATVMPGKEPVEKRRARAADVEVTGRGRGEANADLSTHYDATLSESEETGNLSRLGGVLEYWSDGVME